MELQGQDCVIILAHYALTLGNIEETGQQLSKGSLCSIFVVKCVKYLFNIFLVQFNTFLLQFSVLKNEYTVFASVHVWK